MKIDDARNQIFNRSSGILNKIILKIGNMKTISLRPSLKDCRKASTFTSEKRNGPDVVDTQQMLPTLKISCSFGQESKGDSVKFDHVFN